MSYPIYWTNEKVEKLKEMYESGLSMREVGQNINKSTSAIISAMKRHHISRRHASVTRSSQFSKSPLSFQVKPKLSEKDKQLKTAGLMLYLGEGAKSPNGQVNFTNSDPESIVLFLRFFRKIYNPQESRLRCRLYCFSNLNINKEIEYWSKLTQIPLLQFSKPYIAKPKTQKHVKITHGVCHIVYSDKRLLDQILNDIKTLAQYLVS